MCVCVCVREEREEERKERGAEGLRGRGGWAVLTSRDKTDKEDTTDNRKHIVNLFFSPNMEKRLRHVIVTNTFATKLYNYFTLTP